MIESVVLLVVLLACAVATPLVLRRRQASAPGALRVTGRTALTKAAVVAVVTVDHRRLVVGATEGGVQLLTELTGGDQPARVGSGPTPSGSITTTGQAVAPPAVHGTDAVGRPARGIGDAGAAGGGTILSGTPSQGPRIGLVDRLREATVRTRPAGRSDRVHRHR